MILVSNDYYNGTRTPEYLSLCVPGLDSHVAAWFAGDGQMGGNCHDCAILHNFVTLCALDIGRLPVTGRFSGQNVIQAMNEHILDTAGILANYFPKSCYCVA